METYQKAVVLLFDAVPDLAQQPGMASFFLAGLSHPIAAVRHFTLKRIAACTAASSSTAQFMIESDVFPAVLTALLDASTLVSEAALGTVVAWATHGDAQLQLGAATRRRLWTEPALVGMLLAYSDPEQCHIYDSDDDQDDQDYDETAPRPTPATSERALRILDLTVRLVALVPTARAEIEAAAPPLLQRLMGWLARPDPLMALALIKLVEPLTLTPHGLDYLLVDPAGLRFVHILCRLATATDTLPMTVTAILDWIAEMIPHVARYPVAASVGLPVLGDLLRKVVPRYSDSLVTIAALGAVSAVCAQPDGYAVLLGTDKSDVSDASDASSASGLPRSSSLESSVVALIPTAASHPTHEVRVAALHAAAAALAGLDLVALPAAAQSIFAAIGTLSPSGSLPMELLAKYLATPFDDLRFAVLRLLSEVTRFEWGVEVLQSAPGFVEWLTNRRTETSLTGSDWKFTLVQRLVAHPAFTRVVRAQLQPVLVAFHRQGRFFAKPESHVLVEEKFE